MESQVISVPSAGIMLSLSRATAYKAARNGEIPVVKIGRRLLVPRAAIERMLQVEPKAEVQKQ